MNDLQRIFRDPPRESGFMPFRFWNDDLDDAGIVRQLRDWTRRG